MRPPQIVLPSLRYVGFLAATGWAILACAPLRGQVAVSNNDPLLQPLVEYTRPAADQPLPPSEAQLDQLLARAATDSPTMRDQADSVAQSDASRFRSWVRQMPTINASYSIGGFYEANADGSISNALTPGGSFTLSANEPLFHWGGFDAQTKLGILREQIAQNEAVLAYAKFCLDLRKKYYALIVQKAQVVLLSHQLESASHQLEKERILLDHGHSTAAKVTALDLEQSNLDLRKTEAENTLDTSIKDFQFFTGSGNFSIGDVPDVIYLPLATSQDLPSQEQNLSKQAYDHSIAGREADLKEQAINQQIVINNANQKPLFDLGASISQSPYINSNNNELRFGTIIFVGVTGTWTIFDRYETFAATSALLAQRHLVENQSHDNRQQSVNDADASKNKIAYGLRSLEVLKRQLIQQQDEYRRIQILASTGHADQLEVDTARDTLLDTRFQILSQQASVAEGYYSYISDIFRDPALANAPPFTQSR